MYIKIIKNRNINYYIIIGQFNWRTKVVFDIITYTT